MNQKGLDLIGFASIAVILISISFIGFEINGNAIDTAEVNVTVSSSVIINFTTDAIDFGAGFVWQNFSGTGATLDTEGTHTGGTWAVVSAPLILKNEGNEAVNITLESDKTAVAFLGGTSPTFSYKIINNTANACQGQAQGVTYTTFSTSPVLVCTNITPTSDTIDINIELYIPSDAAPSTKTATVTATGTAI